VPADGSCADAIDAGWLEPCGIEGPIPVVCLQSLRNPRNLLVCRESLMPYKDRDTQRRYLQAWRQARKTPAAARLAAEFGRVRVLVEAAEAGEDVEALRMAIAECHALLRQLHGGDNATEDVARPGGVSPGGAV
jgi:hypothetical protein